MTAVVLTGHGGPQKLQLRSDGPRPSPGPGQVLVRVAAAAVNNTDLWTREGAHGLPGDWSARRPGRGGLRHRHGDLAGQIEACSPGCVDAVADVAGPVVQLDLRRLSLHNISLIGSSMHTRSHFATLVAAARAGAIKPVIAAR